MSNEIPNDKCKRRRIVINDENFYLVVGKDFVHVTIPRENDPNFRGTRLIAETLCEEISKLMEEMSSDV